ncbi:MAG: hypothetical protein QNJ46_24940 [Leptolyngbyaceae cyanobacterium MO_188.B28]|nr:hypothetical protein [Leptolyngbyaceae cyanobacterium MO_188.B28]
MNQVTVVVEGHPISVPAEVAGDDELLRKALSVMGPEYAGAQIQRQPDKPITVSPRRGSKGALPVCLAVLDPASDEINPAIECACWLQQQELQQGLVLERAGETAEAIQVAIEAGQQWIQLSHRALQHLDQSTPAPTSLLIPGF